MQKPQLLKRIVRRAPIELLPGHLLPLWEIATLAAGLQGPQSVRHAPSTISSYYYVYFLLLPTYIYIYTFNIYFYFYF
jgi:hypothetical protein